MDRSSASKWPQRGQRYHSCERVKRELASSACQRASVSTALRGNEVRGQTVNQPRSRYTQLARSRGPAHSRMPGSTWVLGPRHCLTADVLLLIAAVPREAIGDFTTCHNVTTNWQWWLHVNTMDIMNKCTRTYDRIFQTYSGQE